MVTELRPLGVRCNIACRYCYQEPTRDLLHTPSAYDLDAMLRTAREIGAPISIFGGEPLLLPLKDLEVLFAAGRDQFGGASVQSNGALISDAHLALFRKYDVRVGISIDGPGELNELRWAHSPAKTRDTSDASMESIRRLCEAKLAPCVIVTLHRSNACPERLPLLLAWVRDLERIGVRFVRLHLLESESESVRKAYSLSEAEMGAALSAFLELERGLQSLRFDIFADMRDALSPEAQGATTCIWNACDPYTTAAVQGVEGDGARSNCGRTNKEGIEFVKAEAPSYERYLALYQTPQADGGCAGCKYFLACKGQCPGTAIDGDWRNRTEHCATWFTLMELMADDLVQSGIVPMSNDERRATLELAMLNEWVMGRNPRPSAILARLGSEPSNASP